MVAECSVNWIKLIVKLVGNIRSKNVGIIKSMITVSKNDFAYRLNNFRI
jgi:hypothetical protein